MAASDIIVAMNLLNSFRHDDNAGDCLATGSANRTHTEPPPLRYQNRTHPDQKLALCMSFRINIVFRIR